MTSIQLFACIGMVTGFFILLRLSPMEFTDGVFRSLTSRPKSLKDEINELKGSSLGGLLGFCTHFKTVLGVGG